MAYEYPQSIPYEGRPLSYTDPSGTKIGPSGDWAKPSGTTSPGQYFGERLGRMESVGMGYESGKYRETLEALRGAQMKEQLLDPFQYMSQVNKAYFQDPRIGATTRGYDEALRGAESGISGFGEEAAGFGDYTKDFLQGVTPEIYARTQQGGPSYVNEAAAAQRQMAQQAIAQQAMMGSRGASMNPAAQRAAIMQASGVQSNMAAQVAAARAQERQQAMQQYLQARQAQLGARQAGLGATGQAAQMRGQMAQMRGEAADRAKQAFGARQGLGMQAHEQLGSTISQIPGFAQSIDWR